MIAVVLAFYLIDAVLLGLYAWLGVIPGRVSLIYAASGACIPAVLMALSAWRGPAFLSSPVCVLAQGMLALLLSLTTAWLHPQIGLPMVLAAISVVATMAIRLRSVDMMITIAIASIALMTLFTSGPMLPAIPIDNAGQQVVSGLFITWTLLKTSAVNVIGAQIRLALDTSNLKLAQALAEVERLANIDELTALPNRRAIMHMLETIRTNMTSSGFSVGIGLLDIDHFKQINDLHGHPIGDAVLRELGGVLIRSIRADDHVGRYGGEEFLLLVPECRDTEHLFSLCERTRSSVEQHDWSTISPTIRVTVSIGLTVGLASESTELWLSRADKALYHAKDRGRNRVAAEIDAGWPAQFG